ncbi:MAG: DUF2800 domain-containing protein [Spirochaetaceae bacterium]
MSLDQSKIDAIEKASGHSVFGSSSLPRIVACPASVGEELNAGLKPSSIYAAKGTELHAWTEKALKAKDPREYILKSDLSIDDTAYILDCIDYFFKIAAKHPDDGSLEVSLEKRGNLQSYGLPEVWGTMDVLITSSLRVDVIDWKFGHGVAVSAKNNIQCLSYLGMAVPYSDSTPLQDRKLFTHIAQPPLQIFEAEPVSYDKLNQTILGDITDAITNARSAAPKYGPSNKACRFCKANMRCRARHKWLQDQALAIQRMSKDPAAVSNEAWSKFLVAARAMKQAISDIESHAINEIMAGRDFPGFKVVAGRSNRAFVDQEKGEAFIKERLGDKAFQPPKMISLAQAEKVDRTLKRDYEWNNLIHTPQGKPKLVGANEAGKALTFGVSSIFNDIASGKIK